MFWLLLALHNVQNRLRSSHESTSSVLVHVVVSGACVDSDLRHTSAVTRDAKSLRFQSHLGKVGPARTPQTVGLARVVILAETQELTASVVSACEESCRSVVLAVATYIAAQRAAHNVQSPR